MASTNGSRLLCVLCAVCWRVRAWTHEVDIAMWRRRAVCWRFYRVLRIIERLVISFVMHTQAVACVRMTLHIIHIRVRNCAYIQINSFAYISMIINIIHIRLRSCAYTFRFPTAPVCVRFVMVRWRAVRFAYISINTESGWVGGVGRHCVCMRAYTCRCVCAHALRWSSDAAGKACILPLRFQPSNKKDVFYFAKEIISYSPL